MYSPDKSLSFLTHCLVTQFCDREDGPYLCAIVECTLNKVKPVDGDNRAFVIPFDILLSHLPKLQKVCIFCSYFKSRYLNFK